jgi:hypothetical protein
MYGTWNRLNAVAVSRNATSTHSAPITGPSDGGTANVSANSTGSESAPMSMRRRRVPRLARSRSVREPITGSMTTSHTFDTVTITPARRAVTPRLSVR